MRVIVVDAAVEHEVSFDDLVEDRRDAIERVHRVVDPDLARGDVARVRGLVAALREVDVDLVTDLLA